MQRANERRLGAAAAVLLAVTLSTLLGMYFWHRTSPETAQRSGAKYGLEDEDVLLFVEAVTRIKEKELSLGPDASRSAIITDVLKSYFSRRDRCCAYLTRDEYRTFRESLRESYVGIGMELKQDASGRILCMPEQGGPAARAGVAPGDYLLEIDGAAVEGKSAITIAAMARGRPGSEVYLTVGSPSGTERRLRVLRSEVELPSVSQRIVDGSAIVRLARFTRNTSTELKELVERRDRGAPLIIDLRGNGGGDLHAAIDAASLFLEEGSPIVTVAARAGKMTYHSKSKPVASESRIYLWQDGGTASAAEVFIAALVYNQRAVSLGRRSAGKATREEIVELSDGSALVLATGSLTTPAGRDYRGDGLQPAHELDAGAMQSQDLLASTRRLSAEDASRRRLKAR